MRPADPNKGVWPTPDWLFKPLHARHRFTLDAAASADNAKCGRYFTAADNALSKTWDTRCFWCNPPYGTKPGTDVWVAHARRQVELGYADAGCLLIPVKAETAWYQDLVWGDNAVIASRKVTAGPIRGRWYRLREPRFDVEVLELRARVSFGDGTGRSTNGFFASALVFFAPGPTPALLPGATT